MKKILISLTAAAALTAAAVPAAAQNYDGYRSYERGYDRGDRYDRRAGDRRAEQLQWRIERAQQRGDIGYQEAARLKGYVGAIANLADRYRRNGYTATERRAIADRYASVERRLRHESRDYGYGYGYRR